MFYIRWFFAMYNLSLLVSWFLRNVLFVTHVYILNSQKRNKDGKKIYLKFSKISADKFYIIYAFLLERKEKLNRNKNMYFTKGFTNRLQRIQIFVKILALHDEESQYINP